MRLEHEDATWRLESGQVRFQEAVSTGEITGVVFEGRGSFEMEIADPVELAQLRRFANDSELRGFDEPFTQMVLRTSDPAILASLPLAPAGVARRHPLARERHDFWLRIRRLDADARVVSALLNPGERFLRVDVKTENFGWLTYDFTSRRHEEIRIERFNKRYSFLEQWVSLDRQADRDIAGRPGAFSGRDLDIEHVDVSASLLRLGKDPGTSETSRHTTEGDFTARVDLVGRGEAQRALQFYLHPFAKVLSVRDAKGTALPFLRDHVGGRSSGIDKRVYDHSLVVILDQPLEAGEKASLSFEYEFEVRNYMPGRGWYPGIDTIDTALRDLHTARLEVTARERYDVRAMGTLESEETNDGLTERVWRVDEPVKMVTFASARKVRESRRTDEELPEVVVFSTPIGSDIDDSLAAIAGDVQASLEFFGEILGIDLRVPSVQTTLIQGSHGQAFGGFLHLAEEAAFRDRTGPVELFIAHEVAHQWAGHLIGWGSYRDQWLSEGLAQYLALLYLRERVERGDELFLEAIQAHADELTGSIESRFSPFSRGSLPLSNKLAARRVGPIAHGYRAGVGEAPAAFLSQSYRKGALVLHMLDRMIQARTGDERAFHGILRDFVASSAGRYPTTEDFVFAVERATNEEWDWFFDQWVYRSEIPTYRWKARKSADRVEIDVRQEDVPEGFRMEVPVRVVLEGGATEEFLVTVDQPEQTVVVETSGRPRKAIFNPDYAVLAKMGKR